MSTHQPMHAALLKWALRLAVSVLLIVLIVYFVPNKQGLIDAARNIRPSVWLAVLALFAGGQAVMALKWRLLMGPQAGASAATCLRAHFAGQASNLFLPGVSGADVVRLLWVVRAGGHKEDVIVASAADRLCDLVALLVLATAGALATARGSPEIIGTLGWTALILTAGGLAAVGLLVFARRMFKHAIWERLDAALRRLSRAPGRLAAVGLLSLTVQGAYVAGNAALGAAAGVETPWAAWYVAWPLAKLVALVPVSVAGLGVRDVALVFFLRPFGGDEASMAAAALAWSSVLVASALGGGIVVLAPRLALGRRVPPAGDSSPSPTVD